MILQTLSRAKRILIIGLSTSALLVVCLFWIFSSTLLNPAFFYQVLQSTEVTSSFDIISEKISTDTILFSSQALNENAQSLLEGIIRFITQKDMSLSNISLGSENAESIRKAVSSVNPDIVSEVPEISRIHPYVLAYFMPGSEIVYTWLHLVQQGVLTVRFFIPALLLLSLFILLFSGNTAQNTIRTLKSTGFLMIFSGFLIRVLQPFVASPLSQAFPDAFIFIQPFLNKTTTLFFFWCASAGVLFFSLALMISLSPLKKGLNKYSRHTGIILAVMLFVYLILFGSEVSSDAVQMVQVPMKQRSINILNQGEQTVHSLVIKLREEGTDAPIQDIELNLVSMDYINEPGFITMKSDVLGNARFILPEGQFFLYADPSTVPNHYISFEPVILSLTTPDNSWYTLYFSKAERVNAARGKKPNTAENENINHETQALEILTPLYHQIPLLK